MSVQTNHVAADVASELNRIQFMVRSMLANIRTAIPVQIKAVSNAGSVSPVGTVDVQPLVSLVDGDGKAWPHGTVFNVPYMRIQGGANAVILDPQVGDIGVAVVCDRDISTVKNAQTVSAPGSIRRHDLSDMIYLNLAIGSGVTPIQYIQFNSSGITIFTPQNVTITGTAAVTVNTNATATVNCATAEVVATTKADITSPHVNVTDGVESLRALVNDLFPAFFNSHTHTSAAPGNPTSTPNQTMGATQLTKILKAG